MIDTLNLSKYIVSKCYNQQKPISNIQLQKILYELNKQYSFDACIEQIGNLYVYPKVYYHFSGFGIMPISIVESYKPVNYQLKEITDEIIDNILSLNIWQCYIKHI